MNFQVESSWVTHFRYSEAIMIYAAYPNSVPTWNTVCVVLMEEPILANLFLLCSIDVWVGRPITLVMVFAKSPFVVSSRIVMLVDLNYALFSS